MVVICVANAGVHCDADAVALAAATTAAEQTISKEQRGAAKTLTAMFLSPTQVQAQMTTPTDATPIVDNHPLTKQQIAGMANGQRPCATMMSLGPPSNCCEWSCGGRNHQMQ
jgi:hypothetical protein